MQNSLLLNIFIFLSAACLVVPLASRFKLGSVLGYLLAGVVIGPHLLGLITDAEKVMHFAEFGVVMMLFLIGLELEPAALWRLRRLIVGMGGLQVALTTLILTTIGIALGYSWQASLTASMALSLSSTALVLQMLGENKLLNNMIGDKSFGVLLFQDIAVIPILVLIPMLAVNGANDAAIHASLISDLHGMLQAIIILSVIAMMIVVGRYGLPHLFHITAKTDLRELFTALSLALMVGITVFMQLLGVSPALGAFIAGLVLANSEYRRTLEADIEPFKGLLLGLFFISVGMGIDFGLLAQNTAQIFLALLLLISVKAIILMLIGRIFKMFMLHNFGYAFALSQGGEFAFVLFQFAGGLAILSHEQTKFLTLLVALSIATTPLLMLFYQRFIIPKFMSVLPQDAFDKIEDQEPIIIAGFGRFGQVIARFLTAQNIKITVLEKDPDQIKLLRKFGFKGYFGDAARLDLLKSAGAARAKLLIIAVDEVETCLEIAEMAREEFPTLTIFARARNRKHAYDLNKLGVAHFKRELFDSSLDMAKEIMIWLGAEESEIGAKAEQFRNHDEETLKQSFAFFEDEKALVNYAKTRRAELGQILQNDSRNF
jgi:glutathione-regulated potassium-efflux system ancillary protein KefC